ncbi:MAG: TPM domain-containing protein [Gemmatimonadaceae bacterium]
MSFPLFAVVTLIAFAQAQSARLSGVANPRTTSGSWVADPGRHLSPATVAAIDSTISALERETTAELAVVVLDSLDGLEPADAAQLLHRRWGVGKAARDNGIVFLWSPALRRTHVSVGYGLEGVLIDSRVGRIQDQSVLPAFRRGDFNAGVLAGVQALASAAREETYAGPERSQGLRPRRDEALPTRTGGGAGAVVGGIAGVLGLLGGGTFLRTRWRRYRRKKCPKGHGRMWLIDEQSDDRFLSTAENLEERLDSVDYDVWMCSTCDERLVLPYKRWFTKFKPCPKCERRTCESRSKTIRAATTSSTGLRKVTRTCKHCGFTDTTEEIIPEVSESSSSSGGSGGGGSSFGGGSSGGGGAGRGY